MINEEDEYANKIMYEKYKPIIISIARRFEKSSNKLGLELEDLIQEGMYGLFLAIKTYKKTEIKFYTYACVCIKGNIYNLIRSARAKKNEILNTSVSYNETLKDSQLELAEVIKNPDELTIIDNLIKKDEIDKIKKAILNLSNKDSLVMELKINGFNNNDIAILLEETKRTIDNRIYRSKFKIKEYILND